MHLNINILNKFIEDDITITSAESLTAGLFQSTLGSVPGISKVFSGGFVTYSNEAKTQLLKIASEDIREYGVVSNKVAILMATNVKKIMHAQVGVSFTGVAGPDKLEGHSAGTVFIGIDYKDHESFALEYHFVGNRQSIREQSVNEALNLLQIEYNK
jgi:nicotinamide-nucleotide amidase